MNRIILDRLEVANGDLPPATLDFQAGLNVVSGPEDRGKTYAFHCLDFLFGARNRPKKDVPESEGYDNAYLYFHVQDDVYYAIRRRFDKAECKVSPTTKASEDIASESQWRK